MFCFSNRSSYTKSFNTETAIQNADETEALLSHSPPDVNEFIRNSRSSKNLEKQRGFKVMMADHLIDVFFPLYSIRRDFARLCKQDQLTKKDDTASRRDRNELPQQYGMAQQEKDKDVLFAKGVDLDKWDPYKGCFYFDNLITNEK